VAADVASPTRTYNFDGEFLLDGRHYGAIATTA
jgi:hypothetical protein